MRFEDGKSYRLYRCPKCYYETKPKRFTFDDEEISTNNTKTNKLRKPVKKSIKNINKKKKRGK